MSKQTEALKLAQEAIDDRASLTRWKKARDAIREALAEQPAQQQEPVALGYMNAGHVHEMQQRRLPYGYVYPKEDVGASVALYTSPPASKPWVGLTELEALGAYEAEQQGRWGDHVRGLLAVEAKLREKNT